MEISESSVNFLAAFNANLDELFENTVKYILIKSESIEMRTEIVVAFSQKYYPEEIGRAVMIVMTENRGKDIYREILELYYDTREADFFSDSVWNFLDDKITRFGSYLSHGDNYECLMYLAILCEIVLVFSVKTRDESVVVKIINKGKENMRIHAISNDYYSTLHSYARLFLNRYYST